MKEVHRILEELSEQHIDAAFEAESQVLYDMHLQIATELQQVLDNFLNKN